MKQNPIRQVVFPILAALIWGTAFVAQDVCADTIGTFTFNAARYAIAVPAPMRRLQSMRFHRPRCCMNWAQNVAGQGSSPVSVQM